MEEEDVSTPSPASRRSSSGRSTGSVSSYVHFSHSPYSTSSSRRLTGPRCTKVGSPFIELMNAGSVSPRADHLLDPSQKVNVATFDTPRNKISTEQITPVRHIQTDSESPILVASVNVKNKEVSLPLPSSSPTALTQISTSTVPSSATPSPGPIVKTIPALDALKAKWLGRSNEIDQITEFLTTPRSNWDDAQCSLQIVGPRSTGKTQIVHDILTHTEIPFATVSATECRGSFRDIFSVLARQLPGIDAQTARVCRTVEALIVHIKAYIAETRPLPFVFVIDEMDEADLVGAFLPETWKQLWMIKQKAQRNIRMIFIGRTSQVNDRLLGSDCILYFHAYPEKTLKRILHNQLRPSDVSSSDFDMFLKYVFIHFPHAIVPDLDDLTYVVRKLWQGVSSTLSDIPRMKRRQQFALVANLQRRMYHRDAESVQKFMSRLESSDYSSADVSRRLDLLINRQAVAAAELPFHSKVALLAFFLASFNPVEHDAILFGSKKRRKKVRSSGAKKQKRSGLEIENENGGGQSNDSQQQPQRFVGPKAFPLERARWIFRAILTDLKGSEDADNAALGIHRYLESLSSMRLIARCSDELELSDIRFKCLATHTFCDAVAKNLGLELDKYLADNAL